MHSGTWAAFLAASVLLTLMPGPDILFVMAQSVSGSRKAGSSVALGLCTGLLVHISAAALGVSAVIYRSEWAFQTVKMLGALYLFYLAWTAWRSAGLNEQHTAETETSSSVSGGSSSFGRLYRRGILMNVLNPKVSLFFVAFLPQFVVPDAGPVPVQMAALGLVFLLQALVIFQTVAFAAGRIGQRFVRGAGAGARRTARIQAVIYAVLGAQLLFLHFV